MTFIKKIIEESKKNKKKIILAEGEEKRVIEAAAIASKEKIANITLLGKKEKINEIAKTNNLDIKSVNIIEPENYEEHEEISNQLYEMKKEKGMTITKARELVKNPLYLGIMLTKNQKADGMIAGCINSTANVLIPTFRILGTKNGVKCASSFFIMEFKETSLGENGIFLFADCGVNPNPNENELAEIAILSAKSFKMMTNKEPLVAMLSYSTNGSAKGELVKKVQNATKIAKKIDPSLKIEGEVQLDAAIIPEISKLKNPNSDIQGKANVLIFPNLEAGNIGYKLAERLGGAAAYGPIMQGIKKPINDLSRGCSANDIVGVVAITSIQASKNIE